MQLSIFTLLLVTSVTFSSPVTSAKGPSILHHLTGRITSSPTNLVPGPLRHVLSLFGLRGRKVPSSMMSMSPFASATNVRPVYAPPVMVPIPANPPTNQPPPPPPTPVSPGNGGMHAAGPFGLGQVLPPFLGDPSEEPRLQFVPLPHHHSQINGGVHESFGPQMLPDHDAKQQVMYIYVDEEGKTIATKVTDPTEGPETSLPPGYNLRPSIKVTPESMSQPEMSDGSIDAATGEIEMPSDAGHKAPQETLYMLSDFKQYVKPLERPTPTHLLQPTSGVTNGGWIPVSPSTSYAESPIAAAVAGAVTSTGTTNANSDSNSSGNNNGNGNSGNGNNSGNVMDPAGESIDTETESDPSHGRGHPNSDEGKGEEYSSDDATAGVSLPDSSSSSSPSPTASSASSSSSSGVSPSSSPFSSPSASLSSAFGDESGSSQGTRILSSSPSENTSGKSVTGVIESANSNNPSNVEDETHSPASKPTVSYIEEADKLKPEVHFHESERISEATSASVATLTDSSSSSASSVTPSSDESSVRQSSINSGSNNPSSNRSRFSVAAVFDSEFKPLYTAKNNGEIQFGQRISNSSPSSSSTSPSSRVPRSVKPQGKRQYLVPIPGSEGSIKAYVVITA